jgi:signal transduction histidine kinase
VAAEARYRWRWRAPPLVLDSALAVVVTALIVLGSIGEAYPSPENAVRGLVPPPWPAYLLVGAAGLVLVVRRRWPVAVWAVATALVMAYTALHTVNGAALLAPTLALYAVVAQRRLLVALACAVLTLPLSLVSWLLGPYGPEPVLPFEVAAAVAAGLAVRSRQAYVAEIRDRAERAERTREEEARRRVDAERLRIARELHDVVAHTMATINVQASAAAHVLTDPPPAAAEALAAIRSASKEGLRELRTILNVLRVSDEHDPTQPAPGLGQLDALVTGTSQAGLPTTVSVTGRLPELSSAVELAAYRIIQESLTNAIKHAGPATATVELRADGGRLHVTVTDTGRGDSGTGGGHGLAGMRERAAAVGGTLESGPGPRGGFRVTAVLPVP